MHKHIHFSGDYSLLKTMGYDFQRLYASNHQQWHNFDADIRIWRKGSALTMNQFPCDVEIVEYLIEHAGGNVALFFNHWTLYYNPHTGKLTETFHDDYTPIHVPLITLAELVKLIKMGWISIKGG